MKDFINNIDWKDNKIKICVSLVSLILLILISICISLLLKNKESPIDDDIVEEESIEVTTSIVEVTYKEVEVMKIVQGNDSYVVVRKVADFGLEPDIQYIEYNGDYLAESDFNLSIEPYDMMTFDGIIMNESINNNNSGGSSIENGLIESKTENEIISDTNIDDLELQSGIDFLSISDKAVSDELIYRLDRTTIINFINTLLNNNYEINTQIATNTYNELYLENKMEKHFYRVIILNGQNLMIISEIENLSGLDINKIMQKIS